MKEYIFLGSTTVDEEALNKVNERLADYNIQIKFRSDVSDGRKVNGLVFDIPDKPKNERHAGRKYSFLGIKVEVIKEALKKDTAENVARNLCGISRATLYRKLKDAEAHNNEYI